MKYIHLVIWMLLLQVGTLFGQTSIQFQEIDFAQAKEKAKQENKLIFLDGYTSWCAPCKWMDANVFTQKEVADYFNTHFINVKYDCEVGEGITLAKQYQIRSFPTYLFIDGEGTLVYRTQSRMEAKQFLQQGERANMPEYQIPGLLSRFQSGDRDAEFLLRFILVMNNVDQSVAERAKKSLDSVANDAFLKSPDGWEVIKMMARSDRDKYGRFFLSNKDYFKSISNPADFEQKEAQLLRYAMYDHIRDKNQAAFDEGLAYFDGLEDPEMKIDAAMFRAEWAGTNSTTKEFIKVTNALRKGVLKKEDQKLSFIARRFARTHTDDVERKKLDQCYVLAKQAVRLNPDEYSNQATFADICIALKKKKEAIKAAEAARALAEAETSKIQNIADALIERAKAI